MKNAQVRLIVILGTISIILILIFQVYWVFNTFSITESQFNQRVKIALYSVAEKVAKLNESQVPYDPVKQMSSNYFIVNVEDVIDLGILEHYLRTEFDRNNINLDYEYAIYDCTTDEMVYGKYISVLPDDRKKITDSEFKKDEELVYYFGVIFPSKTASIIGSLNIWIISAVIVFSTLLFFLYAIVVILRQKKLSEIQKDFINNMTHEFKTPISTISIAADVLSGKEIINDPHRLLQYATIISEQNSRLESQIEKVLQVTTLQHNRIKLKKENVDLHQLISVVTAGFEPVQNETGANIDHNYCNEEIIVIADKHHLINVIYNLIDNAIKYGDKPDIVISTEKMGNKFKLKIEDNGPGIDKKHIKKIFDKFYRVPSDKVRNIKGFGLGLNYVKYIVDAHGWRIEVKSVVGRGSGFWIVIPVEKIENRK